MKKFINILFATAVAALAVISCQKQEQETYTPGAADPDGCYGVFFPTQDASGSHTYDPSMERKVAITVSRTNASGAITVPYTHTESVEGVFNFGTISFADGQKETELEVLFPAAEEGKEISFSVQLEDDNTYISHYGNGAIALDFSVLIVSWQYFLNPETNEKALVTFTQDWWGETAWAYIKYYEVNGKRTCVTETIEHEYNGEKYDTPGFFGTGADYEWNFIWYIENGNVIRIPRQNTGYHHSSYDADVYALDYFYWDAEDPDDEAAFLEFAKDSKDVSYYDGNGGFYLSIRSYYMFGVGGWNPGPHDVVGVAEGFTRVDYSLSLATDYPVDGVTPIYVKAGPDVTSIKYAVYEGELNSAQVAAKMDAIYAGTEATEKFDNFVLDEEDGMNYGAFGIAPESTGAYTVLAVSYGVDEESGKEVAHEQAALIVNHIAAADIETYAVKVSAGAEAVPARYGKYDPTSSFAFYVTGEEIVDAKFSVIKSKDYEADPEAAQLKTKAGASLPAESVAQINVAGGFYTIVQNLNPNTKYTVLVWATNGKADGYTTAEYQTDGLPRVLVATGDYTYKVAFSSWGTDKGLELYFDPNYENYVIENVFYYVDFAFDVDEKGIIHFDPQDTGATYQEIPVYVLESYDYYDEEVIANPAAGIDAAEAEDIRKNSFYDAEKKIYNFNMAFVVPGMGSFGHGWESFVVTEEAPAPSSAPSFGMKNAPASMELYQVNRTWQAPKSNMIVVERELTPVQVSVDFPLSRKEKKVTTRRFDSVIEVR